VLQNLATEILGINAQCQRHMPPTVLPGAAGGPVTMKFGASSSVVPPVADLQTYTQYQAMVRTQLACAKEVHDALLDCAKKIPVADRTSTQQQTGST